MKLTLEFDDIAGAKDFLSFLGNSINAGIRGVAREAQGGAKAEVGVSLDEPKVRKPRLTKDPRYLAVRYPHDDAPEPWHVTLMTEEEFELNKDDGWLWANRDSCCYFGEYTYAQGGPVEVKR